MNNNKMFDQERFAGYLKQAKGKRSINKFAMDSGVDAGYISRLTRCLIKSPPSAAIIKKLADKSHNNVRVEQFLSSAGYIDELQKVVNERVMKETTEKLTGRKMEYQLGDSEDDLKRKRGIEILKNIESNKLEHVLFSLEQAIKE